MNDSNDLDFTSEEFVAQRDYTLASSKTKNQIQVYLIMCSVHFPLYLTESEIAGTI